MTTSTSEYRYASTRAVLLDRASRFEKAEKIFRILQTYYPGRLNEAQVLDIGCSAGLIDAYLADKVGEIYGIDLDQDILPVVTKMAQETPHFTFIHAEGAHLCFHDQTFDIILLNMVYNLLPIEAQYAMMKEIFRCLKPGGICYFAAPNRLFIVESKYKLPFLWAMPLRVARLYVKLCSRYQEYHEYPQTIFGLRAMIRRDFSVWEDITLAIVDHAQDYHLLRTQPRLVHWAVRIIARIGYLFLPNYIFILRKEAA